MSDLKDIKIMLESIYKLEKKVTSVSLTLKLESDTHVPDLMTRIRILPSVALLQRKRKPKANVVGPATHP